MLALASRARRTIDLRESARERAAFSGARRAETTYSVALRKIARQIDELVEGSGVTSEDGEINAAAVPGLQHVLASYASVIEPWGRAVARRMLTEVARRDETAWRSLADRMGRSLSEEIRQAPTGEIFRQLLAEQVGLIKSLPLEAGQRVHALTIQALSDSTRASEIAKEIERSGHVARSRAMLIARTEVGRAATGLTMARALHIGSTHYIWRTAGDADVRKEHRELDGRPIAWDEPPVAGPNGQRYHAGAGPNCRCFCEPIIPTEID